MTISGERTEQLDIFCCVNGFTSDFLSFIDVEFIWFFHRALQLLHVYFVILIQVTRETCVVYLYIRCLNEHHLHLADVV